MLTSLVKTRIKVQFATLFKGLRYNKRGKSLIAIIIILATLLSGYISLTCGFLFKSIILIFNACGRMGDFFSIIFLFHSHNFFLRSFCHIVSTHSRYFTESDMSKIVRL